MKVSELYEQVSRLGFEDSLDDGKGFYHSANRALMQVGAIRPAVGACVIHHNPLPNLLGDHFLTVERTTDLVFEAENAKAYYFETDGGEGSSYVVQHYLPDEGEDGEWVDIGGKTLNGNGVFVPCRGFFKNSGVFTPNRVRIVFKGDYLYHVRCVAFYASVYSSNVNDIPDYAPYKSYDVAVLANDFLTFSSPPVNVESGYDKMSIEYSIEGTNLLLPNTFSGLVRVLYNRRRKELQYSTDPANDDTVLDLDEELASLMPLLVASYIWLEDEEDKAAYYMNLYRERAADVERRKRNYNSLRIKNVYGW